MINGDALFAVSKALSPIARLVTVSPFPIYRLFDARKRVPE